MVAHLLLYSIVFTPFRRAYFLPSDSYAAREVIFPNFAEKLLPFYVVAVAERRILRFSKNSVPF